MASEVAVDLGIWKACASRELLGEGDEQHVAFMIQGEDARRGRLRRGRGRHIAVAEGGSGETSRKHINICDL